MYYDHPLKKTWERMLSRCHNERSSKYPRYGGRGIYVAAEWRDFNRFAGDVLRELGPKPSANHTLDRIDNEEGYFLGNVRWATVKEQNSW